jgi:hypothetical protein
MGMKERAAGRKKRIVAHRASNFKEAEQWDLEFWQNMTPEERLSALVAIRRDVIMVEKSRSVSGNDAEGKVEDGDDSRL